MLKKILKKKREDLVVAYTQQKYPFNGGNALCRYGAPKQTKIFDVFCVMLNRGKKNVPLVRERGREGDSAERLRARDRESEQTILDKKNKRRGGTSEGWVCILNLDIWFWFPN